MGSCTANVGLSCLIKPNENGKIEGKKEAKLVIIKIFFFVVVVYRLLGECCIAEVFCVLFQFSFKCLFVTL